MIDLTVLPPPKVLQEPEFSELFEALVARHRELDPNYAYYTAADPIVELLQAIAYREMVWRNRGNEVAMSRLLAFAEGGDLDHLGSFCPMGDVLRMTLVEANPDVAPPVLEVKEDDKSFRRRIQLKLAAPSTAGPYEHYLYHALSSSPKVKDAHAYSPDYPNGFNMGGRVNLTILSREGNGIPSAGLLEQVRQHVTAEDVGVLTDLITVEPARLKPLTIRASIVLHPDTPVALFNNLTPFFQGEFDKLQALGVPITPSWIMSTLHRQGVQDVVLHEPTTTIRVEPYEYPSISILDIAFGGFYTGVQYDLNDLLQTRLYNQVYQFYRNFAIRNKRALLEILADLSYTPKAGVIQPTLVGFATYLGIKKVTNATGVALPADEIAAAIYFVLSQEYGNVLV